MRAAALCPVHARAIMAALRRMKQPHQAISPLDALPPKGALP
jgi:hypothetical protein